MESGIPAMRPGAETGRHEAWQVILLTSDITVAESVTGILNEVGSHVSVADNAEDLSLLLSAMQFDAVIVDERHPDGVAVMELRKGSPAIPCIVLTRATSHTGCGLPYSDLVSRLEKIICAHLSRERRSEPIDIQKFLTRLGSDISFFNTLAADLLDDLMVKLPELETAVVAGDAPKIEFIAHGLKSVLALFGAEGASTTARLLESAAHEGKTEDVAGMMPHFREELDGIRSQLRQLLTSR